MTWIKICGTTNLEDALTAVEAGADALGFVFYEKSPRKIDPETAQEDRGNDCRQDIEKVGVFVNEPVEKILNTVSAGRSDRSAIARWPNAVEPEFLQQAEGQPET